jgi:glycosyltransferase involved in cell wall biosynthesis
MSAQSNLQAVSASSLSTKCRVAIVVSHPIQHFVHLYKALAKSEQIELKVFFCSKIGLERYFDRDMNVEIQWATDLLGGYDHEFLAEADQITVSGFTSINNPSIIKALKTFNPQVVQLHGYAQLTLLRAMVWCKLMAIPLMLWSDSSLLFKRAAWKTLLKDKILPHLLNQFSAVLSTGDNNTAYYRHYGVNANRIFSCPFTVDEASLLNAKDNKAALKAQVRNQYAIAEDEFVLLFVGKLAPWKRPQDLLDALLIVQKKLGTSTKLVAFFAGNGVMREALEAQTKAQNIRAVFAGFVNVDVLPSIYAMADVLVFPSEKEPYGLSAREAICLGLPLIVSDQIGCIGQSDVVREGENALIYASKDVPMLAAAIHQLSANPAKISAMSAASLRISLEMNASKSVAGFLSAVNAACKK